MSFVEESFLLDEWDENFLMEAIRMEGEAVSSRNPLREAPPGPPNPPYSFSSSFPPPPNSGAVASATLVGSAHTFRTPSQAPVPTFPSFVSCAGDASGSASDFGGFSFSPPRELSQRTTEKHKFDADCEILDAFPSWSDEFGRRSAVFSGREGGGARKDKEVERLKRELGRFSKQLSHLESECMELKRDRSKKDQQLRHAFSQLETKDTEIRSLRMANVEASRLSFKKTRAEVEEVGCDCVNARHTKHDLDVAVNMPCANFEDIKEPSGCFPVDPQISGCPAQKRKDNQTDTSTKLTEPIQHNLISDGLTISSKDRVENSISSKKAAWSKDNMTEVTKTDAHKNRSQVSLEDLAEIHISGKLFAILGFPNHKKTVKSILSTLLASCWKDFCVLFRCMNTASKLNLDFKTDESSSDVPLLDDASSAPDAIKTPCLYNILVKMQSDTAELDDLIEGLLDVCTLENCT